MPGTTDMTTRDERTMEGERRDGARPSPSAPRLADLIARSEASSSSQPLAVTDAPEAPARMEADIPQRIPLHALLVDAIRDTSPVKLGFYHLFWIFVVASFLGLVIETFVSYPVDGVFKDRAGLVWGPFSPIYGCGAVLFSLLNRLRPQNPLVILLACGVIGASFEFFVGTLMEQTFGFVGWSYINEPLNFHGHTSVKMAFVWGVAGLAWLRIALPALVCLLELVPYDVRVRATQVGLAFMAVDVVLTLGAFECWYQRALGTPVESLPQRLFATFFGDDFMRDRFQTISMWTSLASR